MARLGLVIEGDYDEKALAILIRRIRADVTEVVPRICGGPIKGKFIRRLNELKYEGILEKALVVSDAHGRLPNDLIGRLKLELQSANYPFLVVFAVAVQELEAWLLADHVALNAVLARRGVGAGFSPPTHSPETIANPKEVLRAKLGRSVPYTQALAREIAEEADLQRISYWCPSFARFQIAVVDP